MMADSIEHVISYWVMFQKFQSQSLAGFAVVSHWLPFLFFSVYAGALADRFDPRRIIQLGMLCFIVASAGWGYFFVTDTLEMWHAMVLLVIHGFAGVLWGPASQLFVQYVVDRDVLPSAVRLTATARWLGLLMGPALGSALMIAIGPTAGIFVNVVFYLPLLIWLVKAPYGPGASGVKRSNTRPLHGFAEIRSTMRAIAGNRTIVSMTLLAGCASLLVGNAYQAQMPEFAHHLGHGDAGAAYGTLLAADAAGALVAGFVLESRGLLQPNPRTAFVLAMLWCCVIAGFAVRQPIPSRCASLRLGFLPARVRRDGADARADQCAGRYPRTRDRPLQHVSPGPSRLLRRHGRHARAAIGIHWSLALSALALLAATAALLAFATRMRSD